ICPDRDLLCAAESRDELEVVLVVFLTEECLLSAVSPLGDMVGHARSYHTCQSSYGGKLTRPQPRVKSCRVEVWRGGLGRCLCSLLARSFGCGCHIISTMLRFHTPLIKPGGGKSGEIRCRCIILAREIRCRKSGPDFHQECFTSRDNDG